MPDNQRNLPNFYITANGVSETYTRPPKGGGNKTYPQRNRIEHAEALRQAFEQVLENYQQQKLLREPELAIGESGFYVEFQIQESELEAVEKLENSPKHIELVAVRPSDLADETVLATVFVPDKASDFFPSKIEAYRDRDTETGKPKNESLITRLDDVHLATVRSLFTDNIALFPQEDQIIWWEVWLRRGRREDFIQVAQILNIRVEDNVISFPEREVVLALTHVTNLSKLINNTDIIAELRLAKDSPSIFFDPDMDMQEQIAWVNDLAQRTIIPPSDGNLAICLLDSGVTRIHRLIALALAPEDMLTCDPTWGVADSKYWHGHGTEMAGIALYGDLYNALATSKQVHLTHILESVKILPDTGVNDPKLYGAITREAVSRIEINKPKRQRVFCMAITSGVDTNAGKPSSWSAAVDQITIEFQRLMVIPVGNIRDAIICDQYLDLNDVSAAENPSQAWNAIVVGAYTDKVNIVDPKYTKWQTVAPAGDLSPRSRTSILWSEQWPVRPDVTFEGGNLATDGQSSALEIDDLRLLTTYFQPNVRQFNISGDTSAATALCCNMAARIWAKHPRYWPETVRALIVHSAEWTPAMYSRIPKKASQTQKLSILLRRYGYGVPNLQRALFSSKNDLTIVFEDQLQPFHKADDGRIKTKEMNLHVLPWPKEELENLREAKVEMRVTLSYFIEPNPGERGWQRKHSYASHGLRLAVKRSLENLPDFRKRINKEAREIEEDKASSSSSETGWFLGSKIWNRGSIHSDIWQGTAAELAEKDAIGIYPVGGWWKYNPSLEGWNKTSRYALIVSIRVLSEVNVDIYAPIANKIQQTVPINM
ncbi:Peptidase S8/S53 domain-containing protein [Nostoc sp. DSM 114161]|jgi:hypothetical protein|uniref:S8 family peptidase n=1 Tax=Nostoc sp. DSM 114161 TaxID=3440143 RepID=UPI00404604F6